MYSDQNLSARKLKAVLIMKVRATFKSQKISLRYLQTVTKKITLLFHLLTYARDSTYHFQYSGVKDN